MRLLIVESPHKAKTIHQFLRDAGWKVVATRGHFRDMVRQGNASDGYGIDPSDCSIRYEVTKPDVVEYLKAQANGFDSIYIGTDPDREGEAIAWHITQILPKGKRYFRVKFNEVTRTAVQRAIAGPVLINEALVHAQEGRRAVDRLVGYRITDRLRRDRGTDKTAGRVQTAALTMVVQRQREIDGFIPVDHFGVLATCSEGEDTPCFSAVWISREFLPEQSGPLWTDRNAAVLVSKATRFAVVSSSESWESEEPPEPFTTASMISAACQLLNMTPDQVMKIAQSLYEQGLITYHRTDSTSLSQEADQQLQDFLKSKGVPTDPHRKFTSAPGSQGAHECIRPTEIGNQKPDATPDEQALYKLIRDRTLVARVVPARYRVLSVLLRAEGHLLRGRPLHFAITGRAVAAGGRGWRRLASKVETRPPPETVDLTAIEALTPGAILTGSCELQEFRTYPPERYTFATLIEALEQQGIGRPSTYAPITSKIQEYGFVALDNAYLIPTKVGDEIVEDLEQASISIVDLAYTRAMEQELDQVASAGAHSHPAYQRLVRACNRRLDEELTRLKPAVGSQSNKHFCCGQAMVLRKLERGFVFTCFKFPNCKNTARPTVQELVRAGQSADANGTSRPYTPIGRRVR